MALTWQVLRRRRGRLQQKKRCQARAKLVDEVLSSRCLGPVDDAACCPVCSSSFPPGLASKQVAAAKRQIRDEGPAVKRLGASQIRSLRRRLSASVKSFQLVTLKPFTFATMAAAAEEARGVRL